MIIYKITNLINNKVYIGQTQNTLERRMRNHFSLNRKASNSALHNSIKKYGKEAFKVEVLACAVNITDLNYLETYFINFYNTVSPNGYNLTFGGENHIRSKETCEKLSKSNTGRPGPMKGKKHTEVTKIKMKKPKSIEHRQKLSTFWTDKNLKPVIAFNDIESIIFSGIKYAEKYGFGRRNVHKSLQTGSKYKGYTFIYLDSLEQE